MGTECLKLVSDSKVYNLEEIESFSLQENGLKMGDQFVVYPVYGRKKSLVLHRSSYFFESDNIQECHIVSTQIKLPSIKENRKSSFQMILCHKGLVNYDDKKSCYLLRAMGTQPFKLNGSLCFESFLERGDIVDIDNNRIVFNKVPKLVDGKNDEYSDDNVEEIFVNNQKVVGSEINILIEGETGTGKSRLAKIIHEKSGRSGRFVNINLSSFSEGLIESELFGHVKGAFTGAVANKEGAFLQANRGTLFLDEIDSLPHSIQTKLLLFLDSKEVRPVGATSSTKSDVRLIFASGKSLKMLVQNEKMRQDFYYRLSSGIVCQLLPLRKRPALLESICKNICLEKGIYMSPSLVSFYKKVKWPGNVRQFIGHLNKKIISTGSNKLIFDKQDELLLIENKLQNEIIQEEILPLEELKKKYVYKIFKYFDHDINKAALVLGITKTTLRKLVNEYSDLGSNDVVK